MTWLLLLELWAACLVGFVLGLVIPNELRVRAQALQLRPLDDAPDWDWPIRAVPDEQRATMVLEQPVTEEAVERAYTTIEYGPNGEARAVTYDIHGNPWPASTRG